MFSLFKHNTSLQFVLVLLVELALWMGAFVNPQPMPEASGGVIYGWVYSWLNGSLWLTTIVAFLLVFGEGFLFNHILYRCRLIDHNTLLPMLLYVVAMSCQPLSHTVTPQLLLNLVVMLMLMCALVRGVQPVISSDAIFCFTALFAIATMVTPTAVALLLVVLLFIALYKLYNLRELVLCLLGFMAPYVVWVMCYFMTDSLPSVADALWRQISTFSVVIGSASITDYVQIGVYVFTALVALLLNGGLRQSKLVVDNNNNLVVIMLFVSGLVMLFYAQLFPFSLQLFALPFAYAVSLLFLGVGRHWFWKVLFIVLAVVSLVGNYIIF